MEEEGWGDTLGLVRCWCVDCGVWVLRSDLGVVVIRVG